MKQNLFELLTYKTQTYWASSFIHMITLGSQGKNKDHHGYLVFLSVQILFLFLLFSSGLMGTVIKNTLAMGMLSERPFKKSRKILISQYYTKGNVL